MEESSIPKRNILLAAALAMGVYMIWYRWLMPVPPRPIAQPLAPAPASQALVAQALVETPAPIHPFASASRQGTILLDSGGAITELEFTNPSTQKTDPILLKGSSFLSTKIPSHPQERWKIASDGQGAVLELRTPEGLYQKKFIFSPLQEGFGVLLLDFESSGRASGLIEISLDAKLPDEDSKNIRLFAGYKGKKSLIVNFASKKQLEMPLKFEQDHALQAAGATSRYHLSLAHNLDQIKTLSPLRQGSAPSWSWTVSLASGQTVEIPFYCGIKTEKAMKELRLDNMLYGGILGPLKRLVRLTLSAFYKLTGNYGFAIILLTLVFQVFLLPFTLKNLKFTQKMKDLSPKIQQLQAKYKSDPKKMNEEMMQLYRGYGANPLGGCLTMLLQMPIFFALYSALNDSYELYGAPFMFWIKNLAVHDPTYILPLLMGGAMFLQTIKSQPTIADPSQKMMMYVMPVMFTFMFLKFPSGLVLYWLTSNLVSLGLTTILPKFMEKVS
ncbi:MAG: membrane protein insertase YidC [Elusimicrobiota bacterium]